MFESWSRIFQTLLAEIMVIGSVLVWITWIIRYRTGIPLWDHRNPPLARIPLGLFAGVVGWLAFQVLLRGLSPAETPSAVPLFAVQLLTLINLLIFAAIPIFLCEGRRRRLSEVGLATDGMRQQVIIGITGFFAAVLPTGLLLILSMAWRTEETQHALLLALRDADHWDMLIWICISAIIAAPLAEELLFRVVLQGWLNERLPGWLAIGFTAILFALVHGWRDALPLIPLSLLLGTMYHRTRRYWSCVITHALFNASNLLMALLVE